MAMLLGMRTLQPKDYKHFPRNLSEIEQTLGAMIDHKARSLRGAGICFWVGVVLLAGLIVVIIFPA
jgi:hypothetical protein